MKTITVTDDQYQTIIAALNAFSRKREADAATLRALQQQGLQISDTSALIRQSEASALQAACLSTNLQYKESAHV